MKKFFNYVVPAIAFMLAVSFAKANEFGDVVNVSNSSIVKVMVGTNASLHEISITDINGVQIYDFNNMKPGSYKNLDFSSVPDGRYFIKVENDKTIETTQVDKQGGLVAIAEKPSLLIKPVFKRNGDHLNVYFMNQDKQNVQIDVYNEYNVLVNTLQTNDEIVQKALDFSKSLRGDYKVVVSQDNYSFTSDFDY